MSGLHCWPQLTCARDLTLRGGHQGITHKSTYVEKKERERDEWERKENGKRRRNEKENDINNDVDNDIIE